MIKTMFWSLKPPFRTDMLSIHCDAFDHIFLPSHIWFRETLDLDWGTEIQATIGSHATAAAGQNWISK